MKINVFTMSGALNVPGGGTYGYTADAATGTRANPSGGTLVDGGNAGGPHAQIKWDNTPQVGLALYAVNSNYQWGIGVNVVKVTLDDSAYTYSGPLSQTTIGGEPTMTIDSGFNAVTLDLTFTETGPTVGGKMRGTKFLDVGIIQDVTVAQDGVVFSDGQGYRSSMTGHTYIDFSRVGGNAGPWMYAGGYVQYATDPAPGSAQTSLTMTDRPALRPTDKWSEYPLGLLPVTRFNLEANFLDFLAARTLDATNGADQVYVPVAQGAWHFNGSGSVTNRIWTALSQSETGGDRRR